MKLSEAIRLGSMLRPQATGHYHGAEGSCAIGAAYEAIGQRFAGNDETVSEFWPLHMEVRHPLHPNMSCHLGIVITGLNDGYHWTREQIADWVATIEPPEQPEPVAVLVGAELVKA